MNDLKQYQIVHEALVAIQEDIQKGLYVNRGICNTFLRKVRTATGKYTAVGVNTKLSSLMQSWPEYSGNTSYVIGQSSNDGRRLYEVVPYYWQGSEAEWLWSMKSPYGRKRRELLAWLINRCEEITGKVL